MVPGTGGHGKYRRKVIHHGPRNSHDILLIPVICRNKNNRPGFHQRERFSNFHFFHSRIPLNVCMMTQSHANIFMIPALEIPLNPPFKRGTLIPQGIGEISSKFLTALGIRPANQWQRQAVCWIYNTVIVFHFFICFLTDLRNRPNALSFFRLSRYDIS